MLRNTRCGFSFDSYQWQRQHTHTFHINHFDKYILKFLKQENQSIVSNSLGLSLDGIAHCHLYIKHMLHNVNIIWCILSNIHGI